MDEITLQLAWNRLLAIVEEQAQTLMRTAFSTVVREAGDLSAGVFDVQGQMLAQAVTGTPGHVNSMADAVGKFLAKYPLDTLVDGDVLVTNDPWDGTGHLNDFTVVTPIYHNSRCVCLFASTSHIADVGGRGFGPDANDVFEEGIRIPITHLFRHRRDGDGNGGGDRGDGSGGGEVDETLMRVIKANVRDPLTAEGDLYSLAACNDSGGGEVRDMLRDFNLAGLVDVGAAVLARSRDAMLAEIRSLSPGTYRFQMTVDGYDEPVDLVCALTVSADGIEVDFAGSSHTSPRGINVPLAYTQAYASFGVRCVIGNDIPNNGGSLSLVNVRAPAGCILNAEHPRAVSARHAIGQMLPDVVLGCLHQVVPERVPAEGASCIWNPVFLSELSEGVATGQAGANQAVESFVINPIFNGGTGARPGKDGLSTTAFPSGVRTTPTEINEVTSPLVIWRKEYLPDSGGDGEFRGGLGQIIEVSHRHDQPFVVSKMFDRLHHPARGREGGLPGAPGRVFVHTRGRSDPASSIDDSGERNLPGKGRDRIAAGETLVLHTPGGGGIGDPARRSREARARDRLAGLTEE